MMLDSQMDEEMPVRATHMPHRISRGRVVWFWEVVADDVRRLLAGQQRCDGCGNCPRDEPDGTGAAWVMRAAPNGACGMGQWR